ncbi:MAG: substrate-binding periplasmic protein [Roseateles sp.]
MRSARLLAISLAGCLAWPAAWAAPLRAALFDVAPYAMRSAEGQVGGRYPELLRALAREAGLTLEVELLPFARIAPQLRDGAADLTVGFATAGLEAAALPLGEVLSVESLVVTSRQRPARQVAELAGFVIGRARGGCQDRERQALPGLTFTEVNHFASGLRMLALGRLDGLCLTREVLQHYGRETGVTPAQLDPEIVISRRSAQLFVRRDLDPQLRQRLAEALPRALARRPH